MEKKIQTFIDACRSRSETIRRVTNEQGRQSLTKFIALQKEKLFCNNRLSSLQNKEDFLDICYDYVQEKLDKDLAWRVQEALLIGAIHMADHLGGIYSPQSFQGDLLFGSMLGAECIPCFSEGGVPLKSTTYARGIKYFSVPDLSGKLPIFPCKSERYAASLAEGFTVVNIEQAKKNTANIVDEQTKKVMYKILTDIYQSETILREIRFADQVPRLGVALSRSLGEFTARAPLIYMESEDIFGRLFLRDIDDPSSLVALMLGEPTILKALAVPDEEGEAPGNLLFKANDGHGHMVPLKLTEEPMLRGKTIYGEELSFDLNIAALKEAVQKKYLFVTVYVRILMLVFARGFTMYGGIFQSAYLPKWQAKVATVLSTCGYHDLAEEFLKWDVSGYISGPIFALHRMGKKAVHAGPVEWMMHFPCTEVIEGLIDGTTVFDAHIMGLFEFYHDLFLKNERLVGWETALADYMGEMYVGNCLNEA